MRSNSTLVNACLDPLAQAGISVWLPLLDNKPRPLPSADNDSGDSMEGLRILVVDDMEDMLQVSRSLLEVNGAIVFAASSALDGLASLEKEKVDLLISDIRLATVTRSCAGSAKG
jgi:hypothetical protein